MIVQDRNEKITLVMNKIFAYLNTNLNLKKDLEDYYKVSGVSKNDRRALNNCTINYIFDRRLGQNKKDIFDFALSDIQDLSDEEKKIIYSLKNSIDGVFEVRKITRDSFELFNIINEKSYIVRPLAKMVKFRNLSVGHFMLARIIFTNDEYFLYHVADHITYSNRIIAFQIAVSRLAQNPSLFYFDNPEKLEELKERSLDVYEKFNNLFDSNFVVTSNKAADSLIEFINDYLEDGKKSAKSKIDKYVCPYKNSAYFDIGELGVAGNLFVEAKKGFSAQDKKYNVALLVDENEGLLVIPSMDIFLQIFEVEDYKSIENYKACVNKFISDTHISPTVLKIANEKYPETFLLRVNEIMETNFTSLNEIMQKYKAFFIDNPYTSSTLTLYSSYAFKRLIEVIQEPKEQSEQHKKIGRNDLCPCGSGLKYKKCCGMIVQI